MPVGKNETKEQYYKRMLFELSLAESLFGDELAEIRKELEELETVWDKIDASDQKKIKNK
tara:strand:- start:226 stop:405 length:180 start_codon:yes stop_codon:yes gene_type:complete